MIRRAYRKEWRRRRDDIAAIDDQISIRRPHRVESGSRRETNRITASDRNLEHARTLGVDPFGDDPIAIRRPGRRAQRLLSLFTSAECAEAIAGDLAEERRDRARCGSGDMYWAR